jgi:hypothetical protein
VKAEIYILTASATGQNTRFKELLEEGADIKEVKVDHWGRIHTVWSHLHVNTQRASTFIANAEFSSLLKIMVMLDDAPASFIKEQLPQHAELCTRGRQLRAQLPLYVEQQRAHIVAHCPLPAVLQNVVVGYATITSEDMWTEGLRVCMRMLTSTLV